MKLYANNKCLDLSFHQIMGILNFTPDSFSDSGQFSVLDKALFQVEKMLKKVQQLLILAVSQLDQWQKKCLKLKNCNV